MYPKRLASEELEYSDTSLPVMMSVGRLYGNCKGAVIYEGTREIHKIMQADYLLG